MSKSRRSRPCDQNQRRASCPCYDPGQPGYRLKRRNEAGHAAGSPSGEEPYMSDLAARQQLFSLISAIFPKEQSGGAKRPGVAAGALHTGSIWSGNSGPQDPLVSNLSKNSAACHAKGFARGPWKPVPRTEASAVRCRCCPAAASLFEERLNRREGAYGGGRLSRQHPARNFLG